MPLFDFFRKSKQREPRTKDKQSTREDGQEKSKLSKRTSVKENSKSIKQPSVRQPSVRQPSVRQPSVQRSAVAAVAPPLTNLSISRNGTKRDVLARKESKYHKPIVQKAEDVRTHATVDLNLEELHWHSGGVFSNVYRGKLVNPERMEVAIKKTWPKDTVKSDEMIILAAMRRADPKNIIKLLYIFKNTAPDGTECEAFIFAYMPETLDKVIRRGLDAIDIKIYIWQLFNGLDFLAANRIAHRDIKPINILVNKESGELQIGDFGSAKVISSRERSSAYQVTRYYRPPEMLLGSTHYSHLIDVWSAGCVFGEMIKGRVLFRGSDSDHQMILIQYAFGTPSGEELKRMKVTVNPSKLRNVNKTGILVSLRLQHDRDPPVLSPSVAASVNLLKRILVYNPENRLCGKDLLSDPYFDDVLSANCVRENGQRPELHRQSEDTMCHQCFERSQRSVSRVSRMAAAPENEMLNLSKSEQTSVQVGSADDDDSNDNGVVQGPTKK